MLAPGPRAIAVAAAIAAAACGSSGAGAASGEASDAAAPSASGRDRPGPWADPSDVAPAPDTHLPVKPTRVGVAFVLVAYKGAERAPAGVTRSKDAAKARAEEALAKLQSGKQTFAEIAKAYSDDPVTKKTGGAMGNIEEWVMPEPFWNAATALSVGDTSGVVESPRGYYLIQRTK